MYSQRGKKKKKSSHLLLHPNIASEFYGKECLEIVTKFFSYFVDGIAKGYSWFQDDNKTMR